MEHGGPPPDRQFDRLERMAARLIDRGQGPEACERRATGIPESLVPGHPSRGGFGALPLREHACARWAGWAFQRVWGATHAAGRAMPPWQQIMVALIRKARPGVQALEVLTAARDGPGWESGDLPEEVRRVVTALAFLPPVTDIGEDPLVPGAWCWNAPLWGNPLLPQL